VPPPAWEEIVVTGKARAAIRRATRAAVRKQYAGLGRRIVERLFSAPRRIIRTRSCRARCRGSRASSIEEVMAAVGRGEMKASDVARAMYPDYLEERAALATPKGDSSWLGLRRANR
jgi:guanosine-3',5'-bis(diphosphate) 3'-pyrophosphohydrolase